MVNLISFHVMIIKHVFQKEKLDEVMEEIRILKSIILKQEVRIRELEKKVEEQKIPVPAEASLEENGKQNQVNNNHHEPVSITVEEV